MIARPVVPSFTGRAWRRPVGAFALTLLGAIAASPAADPPDGELRVRLRSHSRHELSVLRLDRGELHLRPIDTEAGEIVVPLEEARELQFILPASYREAQQRVYHGRPAEGLLLLDEVVPPLVPFLDAPGTNAAPAVAFYFDLLLSQQQWDRARELAGRLPLKGATRAFVPKVVQLARALRGIGRRQDAAAVASAIPIEKEDRSVLRLLGELADEFRRMGQLHVAERLHAGLRAHDAPDEAEYRALILAYLAFRQGEIQRAVALLSALEETEPRPENLPLFLLLHGHVALKEERPGDALDVLGRALVIAGGASEWRAELQAVIARGYRARGHGAVAVLIEDDLRRLHPDSPWTVPDEADSAAPAGAG